MTRRPVSRAHPPLVIAGIMWRRWLTADGRTVTITLPVVNFGRQVPQEPSIVVTVHERRAPSILIGRKPAIWQWQRSRDPHGRFVPA